MLNEENTATAAVVFGDDLDGRIDEEVIGLGEVNALMNAVRREERERAIAVLRPFAQMARLFDGPFGPHGGGGTPDHGAFKSGGAWQENGVSYTVTWGHFRAASSRGGRIDG